MKYHRDVLAQIAIGDVLEYLRVGTGLSIEEVAKGLGLSTRRYGRIVTGERALTHTQALLAADLFGVGIDELRRLTGITLEQWEAQSLATSDELRRIHRARLHQLLLCMEREGMPGAAEARAWLERRYGASEADKPEGAAPGDAAGEALEGRRAGTGKAARGSPRDAARERRSMRDG
jgi:plasmid maintenance system antidote protein VapI